MKIQEELEKLFIEDHICCDKDIIARYEIQKDRLIAFIQSDLISEEIKSMCIKREEEIIKEIDGQYAKIIDSVELYLNGKISEAIDIIRKNFFESTYIKYEETIYIDSVFYRIRENKTYNLFKQYEMFHIPFEKRGLVGNQRFSYDGYPCLYLGQSVYGCWEETKRPDIDRFNVVALKTQSQFRLFSLIIPDFQNKDITENYLLSLSLRLACSLPVNQHDNIFKPEYIIPQIILNCMLLQPKTKDGDGEYDGMQYTSTVYNSSRKMFSDDRLLLTNYIFPINKSCSDGLCRTLVNKFKMTETTSLTNARITRDCEHTIGWEPIESPAKSAYELTEFGRIEQELSKSDFHPIKHTKQ